MQSMPFGSSFEYTKQLNASLNCSPQGPCAMPPRQGQSQFISPVSSLNAPSCDASCSVSSSPAGRGSSKAPDAESAIAVLGDASGVTEGDFGCRVGFIESRVGYDVSSGVVEWASEGETGDVD